MDDRSGRRGLQGYPVRVPVSSVRRQPGRAVVHGRERLLPGGHPAQLEALDVRDRVRRLPRHQRRRRPCHPQGHSPEKTKEVVLDAGHCPHDEVPDQVNSALLEWINQL